MIENVSYKKCTCDVCGLTVDIMQRYELPTNWAKFTLRAPNTNAGIDIDMDLCGTCADTLKEKVNEMEAAVEQS